MSDTSKALAALSEVAYSASGADFSRDKFANVSIQNREPPAYILAYLLFSIFDAKDHGPMDKVLWHTFIEYKGSLFLVRDFKFGSWSLEARTDDDAQDSVEELVAKLRCAALHASRALALELQPSIDSEEFYIHNTYRTLRSIYEFHLEQARLGLDALARAEKPPTGQPFDFGAALTRLRDITGCQQELTCRMFALATAFYSTLETLLDACFAFRDTTEKFAEFRELAWRDRFKVAIPLDLSPGIREVYKRLSELKRNCRDPLAHGLFETSSILVPCKYGGLVPASYERSRLSISYAGAGCAKEYTEQIISVFDEFWAAMSQVHSLQCIIRFLECGFSVPVKQEAIQTIRAEMSSETTFEAYLDGRIARFEMAVNREF